jgi:hypothetical protein
MASLKFYNTTTSQWEVIKTDTLGGVIPNNQTWTATQGQTTFTLLNGTVADPKLISVFVDGKARTDFTMPDNATIQFLSGISSGLQVYAQWFEVSVPATTGHHQTHELGGQDAIDVTKLTNYTNNIATPLITAQTNITNLQTDVTSHKNNTSNPHAVTASQVGAYSKTEADTKLATKITGGSNLRIDLEYGIFFTNGGSTRASATFTFGSAFTTPPNVIPCNITQTTSYSDMIYYPFIYGVTTTGFNVRLDSISNLGVLGDPKNIFMAFLAIGN